MIYHLFGMCDYTPDIHAEGYIVFVFLFVSSYVHSFVLTFVEFKTKFWLKFLKWCISH